MHSSQLPLAVTLGDPCGIGPDIIIKAWLEAEASDLPDMFVIGSAKAITKRIEKMGLELKINEIQTPIASTNGILNVLDTGYPANGNPAQPEEFDAQSTIKAIELAVELTAAGQAGGIVTAPINKKTLYNAGFTHPGHTEFLAELAKRQTGAEAFPVMMLAGPQLRTVPVTIHIALDAVAETLTNDLIMRTARIVSDDLKSRMGIKEPRLAVAGLNPHAGEEGSMGMQDIEVISPAIEALKNEGLNVVGPLPADTMFHASARKRYDVALCMYHDQALIPAKTLAFDEAVNVTLGLPFIRTSPDHGTAYDIAGTGVANPSSFKAALNMADGMMRCTRNG